MFNYSHPKYRQARTQALARSKGTCQFCGRNPAVEAHHWALEYKPARETVADDLTSLCNICHEMATNLRRFNGDHWKFRTLFREAISKCYTT